MARLVVNNSPHMFQVPIFMPCHMFIPIAEFPGETKFPPLTWAVANFRPLGSGPKSRQSLAGLLDTIGSRVFINYMNVFKVLISCMVYEERISLDSGF